MKKRKTYHIITIGCQMNKSDSERMAGYLENQGLKPAQKREQADLVIVNTCGVRQSAEDRVYGLIPKIRKENAGAKIILTGCLSERDDVKKRLKDVVDVWLPVQKITNYKLQITNKFQNPKSKSDVMLRHKESASCEYLNTKPKYNSKVSAFVPIGNGCDNFCAYCVVPYARGREVYRPAKEIVKEVGGLVKKGYKEINLIAQNVNSYISKNQKSKIKNQNDNIKFKIDNFADLLRMVNDIKGNFWIRFATSHPKDMSNGLIEAIAKLDKVCEHVHLPAQAGDNDILKAMNRKYTVEHYTKLIKKIRKNTPNASISTDIIVGFPGETRKQFENTKKLFREVKFDMAYIAQYSPRFGTAAFKLEDNVNKQEKKRREEELMKILRKTALENNKKYVGKTVEILVEGKNKNGEYFGKTRTNKNVKIYITQKHKNTKTQFVGKFVEVKINNVKDFGMEGELIS